MSEVVVTWMSELGKIGEAGKRKLVLMANSKTKAIRSEGDNDDDVLESKQMKERMVTEQKIKASSTLSEETIFLLMDRFAPL